MVELYLHSPIRLHGMVLNSLSTWTTFSLPLLPIVQWELLLSHSLANYDDVTANTDPDAMLSQFHPALMLYSQPICPRF
jgi:hypothetical protein